MKDIVHDLCDQHPELAAKLDIGARVARDVKDTALLLTRVLADQYIRPLELPDDHTDNK